jgi:hypothetical protein
MDMLSKQEETDNLSLWSTWVADILHCAESDCRFTLIAGDASPRRYYRVYGSAGNTWIFARSPASEKNQEFIRVQTLLTAHGVAAPRVIGADLNAGYLLLEDLGDQLLLPLLNDATVDMWYQKGVATALAFVGMSPSNEELEHYDEALLRHELDLFPEWFVSGLLGVTLPVGTRRTLDDVNTLCLRNAAAQPQIFVHRDFHSRNIMVLANGELAVIDFQDAVIGPVTYDLVSLLKDCYICWPRDAQLRWLRQFYDEVASRCVTSISWDGFIQWFDLMGLQRHLKVLGIFARLHLRDGKSAYLTDLPTVLHYVREVCDLYGHLPEISDLEVLFEQWLVPAMIQQDWYAAPKHWGPSL